MASSTSATVVGGFSLNVPFDGGVGTGVFLVHINFDSSVAFRLS